MNLLQTKQGVSYLALVAMFVQFAFSFGHIYSSQFHVDGSLLSATRGSLIQVAPDYFPSSQDNEEEEHCPTCWTLITAGSLRIADRRGDRMAF